MVAHGAVIDLHRAGFVQRIFDDRAHGIAKTNRSLALKILRRHEDVSLFRDEGRDEAGLFHLGDKLEFNGNALTQNLQILGELHPLYLPYDLKPIPFPVMSA